MQKLVYLALSFVLLFCLMNALEQPAYAYVDPGTGLLAYQTVSALAAGLIFHFRQRLRRFLRRPR